MGEGDVGVDRDDAGRPGRWDGCIAYEVSAPAVESRPMRDWISACSGPCRSDGSSNRIQSKSGQPPAEVVPLDFRELPLVIADDSH